MQLCNLLSIMQIKKENMENEFPWRVVFKNTKNKTRGEEHKDATRLKIIWNTKKYIKWEEWQGYNKPSPK